MKLILLLLCLMSAFCIFSQNIVLQEQVHELETVTVTAQRKMIQRKMDRIVMNVDNNALTSGMNSLDLLSLAPGVFVNSDGTIFISGVSGTRIMINGKLLNFSGVELKDYLQGLSSDHIKSVEIIARPGAEYDASGSGGLINIVLKKNTQAGLHGNVGMDYSQYGSGEYPAYFPRANLNFHAGKPGITSSYSYRNKKDFVGLTQSRSFFDSGIYDSRTNTTGRLESHNVRVGATYDITNKQYVAIDYTGLFRNYNEDSPAFTRITYPNAANNTTSKGEFPMRNKSDLSGIGLNYFLTTDTLGSKLAIIADYMHYTKKTVSNTNSQTFNTEGNLISDTIFNFLNPGKTNITTFDGHYDHFFKSGVQLSFGGKVAITRIDDNNSYDIFRSNEWFSDSNLAFKYSYKENVYAGFANLNGRLVKIEYKIGLRVENSNIKSVLTGNQYNATNNNYVNFFPDVFFKRNTNESGSNSITLSYNRRITRPSFSQLNPYRYYVDNYTIKSGNPFLVPQFTDKYAAAFLLGYAYYFELSYSNIKDRISQYSSEDPLTSYGTITNGNIGKNKIYSGTISIPVQIAKFWSSNNVLLLSHTQSATEGEFNIKKYSFFLQTSHNIKLSPTATMSINAFYTPNIVDGNVVVMNIGTFDIGLMKKFLHDKLSVKIAVKHLFFPNSIDGIVYYNQKSMRIEDDELRRFASLTLNYNFNAGKIFKTKTIESSNISEKSRL